MTIPGALRFALWAAEITDRVARRLAGDDLGQRLAWADEFDYFQVDRGHMPAPVLHVDDMVLRRQARKRHPAGSRLPH